MSFKTGVSATALALALALGIAGVAAQQTPPQTKPEAPRTPVTDQITTQPTETILARDLIGQTVLAPDNAKIGSISDLLLTKDGKTVEGFVVGVGGFLGIGERNIALKMDQLKIMPGSEEGTVKLVVDLKRDDLVNAPPFKSLKDIAAEKRAAERPTQQKPPSSPSQR
jgi:PRC-barrel domain